MPLLIIVLLGAIVLWLLLSVFFEKIGNIVVSVLEKLRHKLDDDDGEERKNE